MQILDKNTKEPYEGQFKVYTKGQRFVIQINDLHLIFTPGDMRRVFRKWLDWILPE